MLWTGLVKQLLKSRTWSTLPRRRPPLTTLIIALCIGISHKLRATISLAFTIAPLIRRVMLLTLGVAVLFSLPCLFIIRLGILGTVRVGVLDQSRHQCTHIITIALEPP